MALTEPGRVLHAGVARVVITPPAGIRMCGYTVQEGVSRGIERELTATALVLSGGQTKTAILAVDILFVQSPHAERIRELYGFEIGIDWRFRVKLLLERRPPGFTVFPQPLGVQQEALAALRLGPR